MREAPTAVLAQEVEKRLLRLTPPQALILSFVALSLIGAVMLKLPLASHGPTSWMQALFTAISAATVTGLVVVDTGTHFTLFGQMVLVALMQSGGLGLMTFGVFISYMLSNKFSFGQRAALSEALNQNGQENLWRLLRWMLGFTIGMELAGTVLLALRWVPEMGWAQGLYFSFFHAVSAFNNAGFALRADSLVAYAGDPLVNTVISALFISGGIGFVVIADMVGKKRFRDYALHTKLMLVGTLVVNVFATLLILMLEYGNAATLGGLTSWGERLWAAWFQAVTPRSAGFNSLDTGALLPATGMLVMVLMFIGGGSGSTAGGIKLSTFIVLVLATRAFLFAQDKPVVFGRSIDSSTMLKALAIAIISLFGVVIGTFILTITESAPFFDIAFEVMSAFSTVGLSRGITANLSDVGQAVLMISMLIGRVGPLTLAFMLANRHRGLVQYPPGPVNVG